MFNLSSEVFSRKGKMKWILVSYVVSVIATVDAFSKYNDTDIQALGIGPGWITIAKFDLSKGDDCPKEWQKVTINGKPMCRGKDDYPGCTSFLYDTNGLCYNKTYGMVRGYQKGTTDGFQASQPNHHNAGINEAYVDGVSITIKQTIGQETYRRHVWTYAAGLTSEGNFPEFNCPCSVTSGPKPPPFVGENYYCSSGAITSASKSTYYTSDPLWQGTGCTNFKDNCCADIGLPWFYREFPAIIGDIEVRICNSQNFYDEGVLIDKLLLLAYEAELPQ